MRQIALALLLASPLLVAGFSRNYAQNVPSNPTAQHPTETYYAIAAGPVTGNRASGINGSFRISEASGPDAGIASNRLGGACIVFRAPDLGYTHMANSCTNQSQCKEGKVEGYCDPDAHQCWAHPPTAENLCRRSGETDPPTQWPQDTDVNISEDHLIPLPPEVKPNAEARVIACLTWAKQHKPCDDPQSMAKWGPSTLIP